VYRKAPYSNRPARDVRNASDAIFRNGGKRSMLTVRRAASAAGAGYTGSIVMGVTR
jgi:hypothetical protein